MPFSTAVRSWSPNSFCSSASDSTNSWKIFGSLGVSGGIGKEKERKREREKEKEKEKE
jgi:hypothetical protein